MDPTYDRAAAVLELKAVTADRIASPHCGIQLQTMFKEGLQETFAIKFYGQIARLTTACVDGPPEEVVVAFQGIISKKTLPPVVNKLSGSRIQHASQSIAVTGLGEESFSATVQALALVHGLFKREVGERLQECTFISSFENHAAIVACNRYFSPKASSLPLDLCKFGNGVDPHGYLLEAAGDNLVHTSENQVLYFERIGQAAGVEYDYKDIKPAALHEGDIVEIQASFVLLPKPDKSFKLCLILRGIGLLEKKFTEDAMVKRFTADFVVPDQPKGPLKRKVGYSDKKISVTRAKLSKMDLDSDKK